MGAHPQVRDLAAGLQQKLARVGGFHMTPLDNLHITTLLLGATDDIPRDQMAIMVSEAQESLARVAPITVTVDRVLYHPEAIMLAVRPTDALSPLLRAAQSATRAATGHDGTINESTTWTPHITIAYSTTNQPVRPIIETIGKENESRTVLIDGLSLMIQWGPERNWKWEQVETAKLEG
jgi:2'-5' RNA ligase